MPQTFAPAILPQTQPSGDFTFKTLDAKFGDGYSQSAGDGLNPRTQTWPLTFIGTHAEVGAIMTFMDARGGYESFYWTPPGPNAVQGLYRCKRYGIVPHVGVQAKMTLTLDEVFAP